MAGHQRHALRELHGSDPLTTVVVVLALDLDHNQEAGLPQCATFRAVAVVVAVEAETASEIP